MSSPSEVALNLEVLSGLDRAWVNARRNERCFLSNKILAVIIATTLAVVTASLKPELLQYKKEYPDAVNTNQYNFIYWLLFIYYSFTALDQLIELYAVYFEREKGALGLLLEMNNFLGLALVTYLSIFIYSDTAKVPDNYSQLHTWLRFQVIWLYICLGLSLLIAVCFRYMQSKQVRKEETEESDAKKEM